MMLSRFIGRLSLTFALLLAAAPLWAGDDAAAVRHVLMSQFDKPEARLSVEPVVISGDASVASWAQGERGGRALLFRHGAQWQIAICAGDALKDAKVLQESGVKPADATKLAQALARAEAALPAAQRAKFSTFDGFLRMDAHGQHPPAQKH
jgi:hypothetical protein